MPLPNSSVPKNAQSRLVASQPAVPATTVALVNPTGYDCYVHIWGGTVTVIALNGTQIGSTGPATVFVGAGDSIALTYSVAPSWSWWYDSLVA